MSSIQPPSWLPTLVATLGLFRHKHPGLADPAQLPGIERELPSGMLDPVWLKAYCDCIGLPDVPPDCLPPLALQIAAAPLHTAILADPRFPFPAMGLVHMSQAVTQYRPIPADATLRLRAFTGEARQERRGMSFTLITEAQLAGEVVWRGETRALAIDRSRLSGKQDVPRQAQEATLPVGAGVCSEVRVQVAEDTGRRYAKIAGDLNPIHQRAWMARMFGFPRAIVHGTWTLARALVMSELPPLPAYHLQASFRRPVELPSAIRIRALTDGQLQRVQVLSEDGLRSYIEAQISPGPTG